MPVHHMGLVCRDMAATERVYTRHFGFHRARVVPLGGDDQIVVLRSGDFYLELFRASSPVPRPVPTPSRWQTICATPSGPFGSTAWASFATLVG